MTPFVALYDPLKVKIIEITFFENFKFLPHFPNENSQFYFFDGHYFESLKYHLNLDNLPNDALVVFVEVLELASTSH